MKSILLLLAILPASAHAQLSWHPSEKHNAGLPSSVKVYETTDSLDGRPFRAFYLEADLNDKQLVFEMRVGNGKRYTAAQYDSMVGPSVLSIINTTFFSFKDNSNLNLVMHNGNVLANNPLSSTVNSKTIYTTRGAFGITKKRRPDIAWVYNVGKSARPYAYDEPAKPFINGTDTIYQQPGTSWPRGAHRWKMREATGGGPVLVQNGQPFVTTREERMGGVDAMHPRSAIGYTADNKLIILAIEGRNKGVSDGAGLEQMAKIFTDLHCVEALNLDGGGSSALYVNHMNTIKPSDSTGQRPVPAVLVIRKK